MSVSAPSFSSSGGNNSCTPQQQPKLRHPYLLLSLMLLVALVLSQTSTSLSRHYMRATMSVEEAMSVYQLALSQQQPLYAEHVVNIPAVGNVTYRLAADVPSAATSPPLVIGVLSTAHQRHHRARVRASWAAGYTDRVFFLVGGDWTPALQQEFAAHGDLLHIGAPEGYRQVTLKVLVWLAVAVRHWPTAVVMKTDDDTYVRVSEVEKLVQRHGGTNTPLYIGRPCRDGKNIVRSDPQHPWFVSRDVLPMAKYPAFAYGGGYVLSASTAACAVQQLYRLNHTTLVPVEDGYVGVLVDACAKASNNEQHQCAVDWRFLTGSPRDVNKRTPDVINYRLVVHKVISYESMMTMHDQACCNTTQVDRGMRDVTADPVSCAYVTCPAKFASQQE